MAKGKGSWSMRTWLILLLVALLAWQGGAYLLGQRNGPEKLVNQLWVERMPSGPRDLVWHLVALEREGRRVGALWHASRWHAVSDGFVWTREGDRFNIVTPQNGCRSTVSARSWKCAGEAPQPFDLCLELQGEGKRYRYYSRSEWGIRSGAPLAPDAQFAASMVQATLALSPVGEGTARGGAACVAELGPPAP